MADIKNPRLLKYAGAKPEKTEASSATSNPRLLKFAKQDASAPAAAPLRSSADVQADISSVEADISSKEQERKKTVAAMNSLRVDIGQGNIAGDVMQNENLLALNTARAAALDKELQELNSKRYSLRGELNKSRAGEYSALVSKDDYAAKSTVATAQNSLYDPNLWRTDRKAANAALNNVEDEGRDLNYGLYQHMTEEELGIYNYLRNTKGDEAAKRYLDFIVDYNEGATGSLKYREGKARANVAQGAAGTLGLAAISGVDRFAAGLGQLGKEDAANKSVTQYAAEVRRGDLGKGMGVAFDVTQAVGNMAPSILLSYVAPTLGLASFGASAGGNAYAEKVREGYDPDNARTYAVLVGLSEVALQYALGGIAKLGGAFNTKVAQKIANIDNAIGRVAAKVGYSSLAEGFEEGLQETLEPVFATVALDDKFTAPEAGEVAYAFLLGALTGGLFEGVNIATTEPALKKAGKEVRKGGKDAIQAVIDRGMLADENSPNRKLAEVLQARIDKGGRIGNYQLGRLQKENERENARAFVKEMMKPEEDEYGREDAVDEGGEWNDGENSGQPTGELDEGAGRAAETEWKAEQRSTADRRRAESENYELTSVSSVLGEDAAADATVRFIPEEAHDNELREIAERTMREVGSKVRFFTGEMRLADGKTTDGVQTPDGSIYVRADSDNFTATQITAHEEMHVRIRQDGELFQAEKEKVRKKFGKRLDHMTLRYAEAYEGVSTGNDYLLEEIICDAYAGMNKYGTKASEAQETVRGEVEARKPKQDTSTDAGRAPPKKKTAKEELAELKQRYADGEIGEAEYDAAEEAIMSRPEMANADNVDEVKFSAADFEIKKAASSTTATTQDAIGDIQEDAPAVRVAQAEPEVKRFSVAEYTDAEKQAHNEAVLDYFGKTYSWAETGYILLDGSRPDFSGRHEGARGGYRTVDHREVAAALGDDYGDGTYSGALTQFMYEGNIRISPESNGINLAMPPTKAQRAALSSFISHMRGEVILDIDDENGNTVVSVEYPRGTHANKVLNDIDNWFENGEEPYVSSLAQFRFSFAAGSANENFGRNVDEWHENGRPSDATFILGSTGEVLQGLGAIESDIYMTGEKVNTIMSDHPEMTLDIIKKIPELLDDPVLVLKSRNVGRRGRNTRLAMFGSVKAENGLPVMVVLDLRPVENGLIIEDMQKVNSAYTKKYGAESFFRASDVMYADKKRAAGLLRTAGFLAPVELQNYGFLGSIAYRGQNVNMAGVPFEEVFADAKPEVKRFSVAERQPAPTFYSKLEREVDGMKQVKIGASSVIPYLKGRGVKDEEIKWSGIEEFLAGKKSVAKDELLEFVRANEMQIEEKTLVSTGEYSDEQMEQLTDIAVGNAMTLEEIEDLWLELFDESLPFTFVMREQKGKWMEYQMATRGVVGDARDTLVRLADAMDENDYWMEQIRKEAKGGDAKWKQYTLDGGDNYREMLFKLPDATYTNTAMSGHWGEAGVLAHARVQDMESDGEPVLFIEEIQSDWHNVGNRIGYHEKGMRSKEEVALAIDEYDNAFMESEIGQELRRKYYEYGATPEQVDNILPMYIESDEDLRGHLYRRAERTIGLTKEDIAAVAEYLPGRAELQREWEDAPIQGKAPDAPFRATYHEFVLKRLLREAAEKGYGYLAWTPGWMQEERWSSEFAEGYRIEYDQDIPKFLNKYGKKWGAKVEEIPLDGQANVTVPALPITEEMRESVMYEGQPRFSFGEQNGYTRETIPKKAQTVLKSEERLLAEDLAEQLSVPKAAQRDFIKPIVAEITDEYLATGDVSQETLDELFETAYKEGRIIDDSFQRENDHIRKYLRDVGVAISRDDASNIADWNAFRKKAFGIVKLDKKGINVSKAYQELSDMNPSLFPEKIIHPADQLQRMYEVGKDLRDPDKYPLEEAYAGEAETFKAWAKNDFIARVQRYMANLKNTRMWLDERAAEKAGANDLVLTTEQAMAKFDEMRRARRAVDKVMARTLLTKNDEELVNRMLRDGLSLDAAKAAADSSANVERVYNVKWQYELLVKELKAYKATIRRRYREAAEKALENSSSWANKSMFALNRETPERVFEMVMGEDAPALIKEYLWPIAKAEANKRRMIERYRDRVRRLDLSRELAEGNVVTESHMVQLLGEAQHNVRYLEEVRSAETRDGKTLEEWRTVVSKLWAENPNMNEAKIKKAIYEFQRIYDNLYEEMNKVRVENGYEPIAYRQGYFPHFQPNSNDGILDAFGKVLGVNTDVASLPTAINGISHTFRPGITYFNHAQQRIGFNTVYDAVEGFEKYIHGAADMIYQTANIQKLRALENEIRYRTTTDGVRDRVDAIMEREDKTSEEKSALIEEEYQNAHFEMNNFVVWLREYTDTLANKKSGLDRATENLLGRGFYEGMTTIMRRVAGNMVAINPGSWLTNLIPLTQASAVIDSNHLLNAMHDAAARRGGKGVPDGYDTMLGDSVFLTNRKHYDPLVSVWEQSRDESATMTKVRRTAGKWEETLSRPMEIIDYGVAEIIVRARYTQNLERGLSETAALEEADQVAARIMAARSKGAMPNIFNSRSPVARLFTQFQLEVNNQLSFMFKDVPDEYKDRSKAALAMALMSLFLHGWLFNQFYELLTGRRSAFDPIEMVNEFVGDATGYEIPSISEAVVDMFKGENPFETERQGIGEAMAGLGKDALEEIPFVGGLLGGGRLPISSALPKWSDVGTALAPWSDWSAEKRAYELGTELAKPLAYIAMPFGGGQLKKTLQGLNAVRRGGSYSVNAAGEEILQYPVFTDNALETGVNIAKAAVFGKSSLPTAVDWVDSNFDSMSTKETALYQALVVVGEKQHLAYDFVRGLSAAENAAAKRDYIVKADLSGDARAAAYYTVATDKEKVALENLADNSNMQIIVPTMVQIRNENKQLGKFKAMAEADLDTTEYMELMQTFMGEDSFDVVRKAAENGLSVEAYVKVRATLDRYDANNNGSYSQAEITDAIDALGGGTLGLPAVKYDDIYTMYLTMEERAVLWQVLTGSKSASSNPYSKKAGQAYLNRTK